MTIKRKPPDSAGGVRKTLGSFGGPTQKQNTEDTRAFQGITNARHADQSGPAWRRPAQADALDALERAWTARRRTL